MSGWGCWSPAHRRVAGPAIVLRRPPGTSEVAEQAQRLGVAEESGRLLVPRPAARHLALFDEPTRAAPRGDQPRPRGARFVVGWVGSFRRSTRPSRAVTWLFARRRGHAPPGSGATHRVVADRTPGQVGQRGVHVVGTGDGRAGARLPTHRGRWTAASGRWRLQGAPFHSLAGPPASPEYLASGVPGGGTSRPMSPAPPRRRMASTAARASQRCSCACCVGPPRAATLPPPARWDWSRRTEQPGQVGLAVGGGTRSPPARRRPAQAEAPSTWADNVTECSGQRHRRVEGRVRFQPPTRARRWRLRTGRSRERRRDCHPVRPMSQLGWV